jgi:hypothetical protein
MSLNVDNHYAKFTQENFKEFPKTYTIDGKLWYW